MKNQIVIDISDSPSLRDYFAGKEVGHVCVLKIPIQINSKSDTEVKGTIDDDIVAMGEDDDEKELEVDSNQPVAIVMMTGAKKEKPSKESKREPVSTY